MMILVLLVVSLPGIGTAANLKDDPKARAVMEKVENREDGDNRVSDMEMVLIDKKGKKRVRKIKSFQKDKGVDTLRLMFFLYPADVKDTAFLTYDYDTADKDDDQWLFLPALHKTKRIASSDKAGSFMGSDLNYSDMTSRNLDDYDFSFYEKGMEMEVHGVKTWVIWSIPRSRKVVEETGYKKSLVWVRQDNDMMVRAINWEKRGGYLKYVDVKKMEKIDGIWAVTEMHVTRKKGKEVRHKTILKFKNIRFNQDFDEDLFTVRRMEKGL
ncbi:MAG: outer membrane lipoprotein-sorting protein [Deltaproteobacteria bacterium]|nr:MAG: outer membrane lipoprotein-sorting protein [Deltaproteobacteria bacterium]